MVQIPAPQPRIPGIVALYCPTQSLCLATWDARLETTSDPADPSPQWTAANLPKVVPPLTSVRPTPRFSTSGVSCVSVQLCVAVDKGRLRIRGQPERSELLDCDEDRLLLTRPSTQLAHRRVVHTERSVRGDRRPRERDRRHNKRLTRVQLAAASPRVVLAATASACKRLRYCAANASTSSRQSWLPKRTTAGRDAGDSRILTALRERLNCLRRCRRQRGAHDCCGRVRGTSTWLRRGYRRAGQSHCAKEKAGRDDRASLTAGRSRQATFVGLGVRPLDRGERVLPRAASI